MTEWFEGLDQEHRAHADSKGWSKPLTPEIATSILQSHRQLERHFGVPADQLLKLPKDVADPAYQQAVDRLNSMRPVPKAEDYKFDGLKFADGSDLPAEIGPKLQALAVEQRLTPAQLTATTKFLMSMADEDLAAETTSRAAAQGANQAALRQRWGAAFDANSYAVTQAMTLAGIPADVLQSIGMLPVEQYIRAMEGLFNFSKRLNEAEILRGGGPNANPSAGMTVEQATTELNRLKGDRGWFQKWMEGDQAALKTFHDLTSIIAASRVPAPAR